MADNSESAVRWFKAAAFDIMILNVRVSAIDGLELTRQIRAFEASIKAESRRTPVIAMIPHDIKVHRERCLKAGIDDYLPLPLKADVLLEKIALWTKGNPSPATCWEL